MYLWPFYRRIMVRPGAAVKETTLDPEQARQDWLNAARAQNAIVEQHAAAVVERDQASQAVTAAESKVQALVDAFANAKAATDAAKAAFDVAALEGVTIQTI